MNAQPEPSFRDLITVLRRGFPFALALALAAAVTVYLVTSRFDDTYRATATLYVAPTGPDLESFGVSIVTAPSMDLSAYAEAATIHPVIVDALSRLGVSEPDPSDIEAFRERITVDTETARTNGLLYLHVEGSAAASAALEAGALAASLMGWDRSRSTQALRQIVATLEAQIAALDQQIADAGQGGQADEAELQSLQALRTDQRQQLLVARTLATSAVGRLEMFEPAVEPLEPVAPNPIRDAVLTALLAFLFGYAIVLARHALAGSVRDTDELARVSGRPILAEFGRYRGRNRRLPEGPSNFLRTNVLFALPNAESRVVLVTSATHDQGTTSVAMSLAESFAHNGEKTLLIDADLRNSVVATQYDLVDGKRNSLGTYTRDEASEMGTSRIDVGMGHGLDVLPGPTSVEAPTEFLTRYFEPLLERAKSRYGVIVVNSAPVLPFADTLAIAPLANGVVLVVSMPTAQQRDVRAAVGLLERSGSNVIGVVANRMDRERGHVGVGGFGYGRQRETA